MDAGGSHSLRVRPREHHPLEGELYHDNPTPERRAEIKAEQSSLAAELRGLHVHDHAEIARIRRDYGQRIREHMAQAKRNAED